MEPKFKISDKVIVCGTLKTVIDAVNKDLNHANIYSFKDEEGRKWSAWECDIELNKEE